MTGTSSNNTRTKAMEYLDNSHYIIGSRNNDTTLLSNIIYSGFETISNLSENEINNNRINYLNRKITPLLLTLIKNEHFEFGQKSESIELIEKQLNKNLSATQEWLSNLYIKYFSTDDTILVGLMRIVEFLSYRLTALGQTMAIASLSHKNDEIKELGVKILESQYTVENYMILKNIETRVSWLQDYINRVITDFKVELCLS